MDTETYRLSDLDELMEYYWLRPQMTGVNADIFVDDGSTYKRRGHPLVVIVRNGYGRECCDFFAVSVGHNPEVLTCNLEMKLPEDVLDDVLTFVSVNADLLKSFADELYEHGEFTDKMTVNEELYAKAAYRLEEQVTVGSEKWGDRTYLIAVSGASSKDRPVPHVHVFLNGDDSAYCQFLFEISIEDIVCKDEINLIYQVDMNHHVKNTDRQDCSWAGYEDIYEGFRKYLFTPIMSTEHALFADNLQRIIYEWNRETDFCKTEQGGNPLKEYLDRKGSKVLPKYMSFFNCLLWE